MMQLKLVGLFYGSWCMCDICVDIFFLWSLPFSCQGWAHCTFRAEAPGLIRDVWWLRQLQRGVHQQLQLRGQWGWRCALHPSQPAHHQEQRTGLHLPWWQSWDGSVHNNCFLCLLFENLDKTCWNGTSRWGSLGLFTSFLKHLLF